MVMRDPALTLAGGLNPVYNRGRHESLVELANFFATSSAYDSAHHGAYAPSYDASSLAPSFARPGGVATRSSFVVSNPLTPSA